jgi:CRP-like cAMP-binding protein
MVRWWRGVVRSDLSKSRIDTLRSTRELAACSTSELRSLLPYVDEVTVPTGTRIATRGEVCDQFVIVAEGRLRAGSPEDGWHRLRPGDSAGWAAMWDMSASEATVIAETEARLLVVGHAQFQAVKAIVDRRPSILATTRYLRTRTPQVTDHQRAG